jgi:mitochondrial inner membrane protease subunit 1
MRRPPSRGDEVPDESRAEPYHRASERLSGVIAAAFAVVTAAAVFLRWRPSRVRIDGASMLPTLFPDDWALLVTPRRYAVGDVVVVEHPGRPGYEMVKRVIAGPGDSVGERTLRGDEWWVEGERADASTDSRHFGPVSTTELKGKLVLIYWPRERRRVLR